MKFYLGTHEVSWLKRLDIPLFISRRRFARQKRWPAALGGWALDSGGFTELSKPPYRWVTTVEQYVQEVEWLRTIVGGLDWAAPMDWMCEPWIIEQTGLSVREHQERTIENYLELRGRGPFIPVLQGWSLADYERCLDLYASAGVDLTQAPLVGVGSVCRRQYSEEIGAIVLTLHQAGVRMHGFGIKKLGLRRYGHLLTSADSMSWSFRARNDEPLPECWHAKCTNCRRYAVRWRGQVLSLIDQPTPNPVPGRINMESSINQPHPSATADDAEDFFGPESFGPESTDPGDFEPNGSAEPQAEQPEQPESEPQAVEPEPEPEPDPTPADDAGTTGLTGEHVAGGAAHPARTGADVPEPAPPQAQRSAPPQPERQSGASSREYIVFHRLALTEEVLKHLLAELESGERGGEPRFAFFEIHRAQARNANEAVSEAYNRYHERLGDTVDMAAVTGKAFQIRHVEPREKVQTRISIT